MPVMILSLEGNFLYAFFMMFLIGAGIVLVSVGIPVLIWFKFVRKLLSKQNYRMRTIIGIFYFLITILIFFWLIIILFFR